MASSYVHAAVLLRHLHDTGVWAATAAVVSCCDLAVPVLTRQMALGAGRVPSVVAAVNLRCLATAGE